MDFDRLPINIFLQILQRLPFKDRVRVAQVSRRFKYGSEFVISRTRAMSLTAPIFRRADSKSMEKLIRLTAANLKELICAVPLESQVQYRSKVLEHLRMIAEFPHLRLEFLKIKTYFSDEPALHMLLSNLPNLRALEWFYSPSKFPGIVCEKLVEVKLRLVDARFLASLAHYCPNVKHVTLDQFRLDDEQIAYFNTAFAKWPALQTLELRPFRSYTMMMEHTDNLWKLKSLQTLIIDHMIWLTDRLLAKISVAFPQLERIQICTGPHVTSQGFSALNKLKQLRQVKLFTWDNSQSVDQFIMELIRCERLEVIECIYGCPSTTTVATLAHRCPKLRRLEIPHIRYLRSPKKARSFVRSLYGFVQANLTIHITCGHAEIWECATVRLALGEINKSTNGRQLSISIGDNEPDVDEIPASEWDIPVDPESGLDDTQMVSGTISANGFSFGAALRFGQRLVEAMLYLPRQMLEIFQQVFDDDDDDDYDYDDDDDDDEVYE